MCILQTHVCYTFAPQALWASWRRKGNLWLHMTLDSYNGSTNGCGRASEMLRTGLPAAEGRGVQDGDGPAEDYRNRVLCIYYGGPPGAAHQARIHTSQHAMRCTHATRLYPINLHPTGRVSARLQPAHRHRPRRTANSPLAASYGARAGRTPLAEPKSLPPEAQPAGGALL